MLYESVAQDGLLLAENLRLLVDDPRSLRRDVDRGLLVKLRRGAYVLSETWNSRSARERHVLRIRTLEAVAERPVVLAGISAAAVWGMPIAGDWGNEVTLHEPWRGGGRSEPGVRRTAAGFSSARVVEVGGFRATDLSRTALSVAREVGFADAVGSADWALWRNNELSVTKWDLADDLARWNPRTGHRHLDRVVSFATDLSDSFGESRARVGIHLCGFAAPELQAEFRDVEGVMRVDFYWVRVRVCCEFDGKLKYTRGFVGAGDPSEVVWQEKKRQDRLNRCGVSVERIVSHDVSHPQLLSRILGEAGVPRRG
jgi:hypothetical protein